MRLLDKLFRLEKGGLVFLCALRRRQCLADVNVAVTRGRLGRLDADGHNRLTATGEVEGVIQNLLEFFPVGNDVVGGQNRHDASRRTRAHQRRAERDGGAGVAAHRLGNEIWLWGVWEVVCGPPAIAPRW